MIAVVLVLALVGLLHDPHSCTPSIEPRIEPNDSGRGIPVSIDGATVRLSCRI